MLSAVTAHSEQQPATESASERGALEGRQSFGPVLAFCLLARLALFKRGDRCCCCCCCVQCSVVSKRQSSRVPLPCAVAPSVTSFALLSSREPSCTAERWSDSMTSVEPPLLPMAVSTYCPAADMASVHTAAPLATSLPPPPPPPSSATAVQPLSATQFRQQLLNTLQTSGTLVSLKTQLRSSVIQQLIQLRLPALLATNNPPPAVQRSLVERLANSLILDYLHALSFTYTHSLFIAELGANNSEELNFSQHDTLALLHVSQSTSVGKQLIAALNQPAPTDTTKTSTSILLALLSTLHSHTAPTTAEMAVQTESSLSDSLEQKLKAVDDELSHTLLYSHPSFSLALEQRMAKLQRETNERTQRDVEQQVAHYKQVELADVRREERDKHAQQLREMQQQLAAQHAQQLKEYKARLDAAEVEYERKVHAMDEERYLGRQRLMSELDQAKAREAELQRLELLMKREVGVEAEVWKERNSRLETQLSTLAAERQRLEERIVEEKRRVEEQLTAQLALKDEQLRSLREADEQLRAQYDKSIKDNLSLTQQLADTQRQHVALSSSSSLVAAAEARSSHLQQQLSDQQRALEYEKGKHADEVKELLWTANVAVERERERGHAMLVKLSNEWKDAYDTLMAEYERGEAERERRVWRERSGGGRTERRSAGSGRRSAWEERREDDEAGTPTQQDVRLHSSAFGSQREPQRHASSAQQQSSPFPAFAPSPAASHSFAAVTPAAASPPAAPTVITVSSPPAAQSSAAPATAATLPAPPSAQVALASPASPAGPLVASPFASPTQLDSSVGSLLFTPPPAASRPPFASPSSALPFPPLQSPATPATAWTEVSEEEERRRAVEAVEKGRDEAKRRREREEKEGLRRQEEEEAADERQRQEREAAEKKVREERERKLREENEKRKQKGEAEQEAAASAATEERKAAQAQEESERAARAEEQQREQWERIVREEQEREEAEEREREAREQKELGEVKRMRDKAEREERSERRRAEREEQRAEEERRRLEEQERQLQASMTAEERREEEEREQRRTEQRQKEADERARQAAQQRATPPAPQPAAAVSSEDSYSDEAVSEVEDEAAVREREKKARMDEFLQRAKERRDRDRQAEKEAAERKRRETEEAEERRLQVGVVRRSSGVAEDIEEELEVETADEAYTADEFDPASESGIADEVEVEAGDEIEEDIEL